MEDTAATLAAELDRLLSMARELEVRLEGDQGAPGTARELCASLGASVNRAMRLAGSCPRGGGGEGWGFIAWGTAGEANRLFFFKVINLIKIYPFFGNR